GSGGGFMHDIEEVGFSYISLDKYNVEEARALYIEVMEGFIERFNADETIRPYLHNYPFTEENLRIRIGFEDENRKHRSDGNIALIFLVNGKVYYEGFDSEKDKFYTLHEEPYATAVEIVKGAS
ncbi:MAG: hypothetical protein ACKVOH_06115, partial [Chlamydiales bacterium]